MMAGGEGHGVGERERGVQATIWAAQLQLDQATSLLGERPQVGARPLALARSPIAS